MTTQNIVVKLAMAAACSIFTLVKQAGRKGYKAVMVGKSYKKHTCPVCKEKMTANAAKGSKPAAPGALKASYTTALLFVHGRSGLRYLACPCGWRRYEEGVTTIAEHMTKTHGGKCQAIKGDGTPCTHKAVEGSAFCGIPAHQAQVAKALNY